MKPSPRIAFLQGMVVLGLMVIRIGFAEQGFQASVAGLRLFFEIVFPSLLPFFLLSEPLLALGVVHVLGEFFEPIMRPLFNVPGVGSFVLSMGLAAGYPMEAVITAKFRRQGLCTKVEGERLLACTNTADPRLTLLKSSRNPRCACVYRVFFPFSEFDSGNRTFGNDLQASFGNGRLLQRRDLPAEAGSIGHDPFDLDSNVFSHEVAPP